VFIARISRKDSTTYSLYSPLQKKMSKRKKIIERKGREKEKGKR
jgi:hypothetical protein